MPRYFLEVSYKGTRYAGFQAQHNAVTIQGEIENAFVTVFHSCKKYFSGSRGLLLTGSSRTDAGVHALQNYFHFDWCEAFDQHHIYNLNAILPDDIVIKSVTEVADDAHSRFDAVSRLYQYKIYSKKNPFLKETGYFFPYPLDIDKMNEAAVLLLVYTDFTSFSKRNTQVKNFTSKILQSRWFKQDALLIYEVQANRFLRGMVRALTATMLKVGRGKITLKEFKNIIETKDCTKAWFDAPAHGLFLNEVQYPLHHSIVISKKDFAV